MFSLALRGIKLFGYLFLTISLLLLVLNFQLIHDGMGNFKVAAKDKLAFTDTFVNGSKSVVSPQRNMMRGRSLPQQPVQNTDIVNNQNNPKVPMATNPVVTDIAVAQSQARCQVFRTKLAEAVVRYNLSHKETPMKDLEIFSLLSEGLIDEIPDCPAGGQYTLIFDKTNGNIKMKCSHHN